MPRQKRLSGGSIASDAVVGAVDKAAFDRLDSYFTNVVEGGCAKCSKCGGSCAKCAKCGGSGWVKKSKKVADKAKRVVKKAVPGKSKKGGSSVAYNYDGLLYDRPLSDSTHNPSVATPMPFKNHHDLSGGNLKKLSELNGSLSYYVRNKRGGDIKSTTNYVPIGISYDTAIKTTGIPVGNSPRGEFASLSANDQLANLPPSSVPAPMDKLVNFGNNLTDTVGPNFSYGTEGHIGTGVPTSGGGLIKKLVVAAVARHVVKKAIKAHKKKKAAKAEKAAKAAPATSKKPSATKSSSKTVKKSA